MKNCELCGCSGFWIDVDYELPEPKQIVKVLIQHENSFALTQQKAYVVYVRENGYSYIAHWQNYSNALALEKEKAVRYWWLDASVGG
jgi:hypothetical protein